MFAILRGVVLLAIPVISLLVGVLAIWGKLFKIPRQWEALLFGAGWVSLLIAGINCRDITLVVITFPLLMISFAVYAVLWKASASSWGKGATCCYWIGILSIIAGAVHFGALAADIQCIDTNCHGVYTPQPPNLERELIVWSLPALMVCLGLRLSKQFGKIRIAMVGALLLLLNPAILLMVARLQPSLGM